MEISINELEFCFFDFRTGDNKNNPDYFEMAV